MKHQLTMDQLVHVLLVICKAHTTPHRARDCRPALGMYGNGRMVLVIFLLPFVAVEKMLAQKWCVCNIASFVPTDITFVQWWYMVTPLPDDLSCMIFRKDTYLSYNNMRMSIKQVRIL